jgi:AraC-like DNA-binding protein
MNIRRFLFTLQNRKPKKIITLFLPVAIVFFVFLLTLAMLFSNTFSKVGIKIITKNYTESLSMIEKYYQQLRGDTATIAENLLENDKIQNYIFSRKEKDVAMIDAYQTLEHILDRNTYLNSIYLYSQKYGYFSSRQENKGVNNLSNPSFLDFIKNCPINNTFYQRSVVYQNSKNFFVNESTQPTLNFFTICNNSYTQNGEIKYGIIVNLDETKVRELFFSDLEDTYTNFYIFQENGKFISHPNSKNNGKDIQDFPLFNIINKQNTISGNAIIKDEKGNKYVACWLRQTELNWRLVYLLPMKQLLYPINSLRNKLIIIFIIILVLSFISIYIASNKMESSISRRSRLIAYIKGDIDSSSFIAYSPGTLFSVAIIKVKHSSMKKLRSEQLYTEKEDFEYISKYFKTKHLFKYLLNLETNVYLYLIPKEIIKLPSYLQKLQINSKKDLSIELNSIYLEGLTSFEELPEVYCNLLFFIKTTSLEEKYFIFPCKDLISNEKEGLTLFNATNLEKALIMKDLKIYDAEVKKLIEGLKVQQDWELFKSLKIYIYYSFKSTFSKYLKINTVLFLEEWKKHMIEATTYKEFEKVLLEIDQLIERSKNHESSKHQKDLIKIIKKIIAENLSDPNLSSTLIADKLKSSLGYVRTQFKNIEGESINEYIGKERLEVAVYLLLQSNKTVNEIRQEIGFSNYSYFCTYFKKFKGCSPLNYRNQITEESI